MKQSKGVIHTDLLIIGAGPAGLAAGVEAARLGVDVLLIDDKEKAGGQLVKQTHMFFGSKHERAGVRGIDIAVELTREFEKAGGRLMTGTMAVGVFEDGVVGALRREREYLRIVPKKMIIAAGAYENMFPFPGCDLPGVYGAGGFQTLMNVEGVLPGKNVLMVGAGNIGLIVSYQTLQAGGTVAAVIEALPHIGGYSVHAAKIRRMGVPIYLSHTVKAVHGSDRVEAATVVKLKNSSEVKDSSFTVAVDAVCLATGLSPLAELFAAAGCRMQYVGALGGYVPYHDENMMTSNENIFVAGDASGIEEASAAMVEGKIAGCAAASAILGSDMEQKIAEHKIRLESLRGGPYGKKARHGKAELWGVPRPEEDEPIPTPVAAADIAFEYGKRAVVECKDRIPCNPCEEACRNGAIKVGEDISNIPVFDPVKCNGCGLCLTRCPGLAIFMVDMDYAPGKAEITIPYEMLPLPKKGESWIALDRNGKPLGPAEITRVVSAKAFDRKSLVSFVVEKRFAHEARHIARTVPDMRTAPGKADDSEHDPIVCRCEDVRKSVIEALIDQGYHTFDEIKRITRVGMGPCQGKACQRPILHMLAQKVGIPIQDVAPMTTRSPLKPISIATMADAEPDNDNNET